MKVKLPPISLQLKYLGLAVIVMGSMGIWLPFILSALLNVESPIDMLPINLTTFYVSLVFAGCVESILKYIQNSDNLSDIKHNAINMIGLILLVFAFIIATVWMTLKSQFILPLSFSIAGTIIAISLWWKNNKNNEDFNDEIRQEGRRIHANNWGK